VVVFAEDKEDNIDPLSDLGTKKGSDSNKNKDLEKKHPAVGQRRIIQS
jgi:hypothetical protein